jgi:ribosomal protein S1
MYDDGFVGSIRLTPNSKIKGSGPKQICYSRESYAQSLFDAYTGKDSKVVKKDLSRGDCAEIVKIIGFNKHSMEIEIEGGLDITIDLRREKRFILAYGFDTVESFVDALQTKEARKSFLSNGVTAYIVESVPSVRVSLWQGYVQSIKDEFMEQISKPTKAYTCTVKEANKGGFFVDILGVDAFMPGSLAAPNKIIDFRSYVGKQIIVMIEDYLKEMNSFIVSHKKYIDFVLPELLDNLDLNQKYTGTVTGTSKYGVFIEFNEMFTGLLHTSKMKESTKLAFDLRQIKSGDSIDFYIAEISRDNRVILTEESPDDRYNRIKQFIFSVKDSVIDGEIVAVMGFGVIVSYGDITGLVPLKEFRRMRIQMNQMKVKDRLNVKFDEFKDEKIVFSLA